MEDSAVAGAGVSGAKTIHRIEASIVKAEVIAAGFVFEEAEMLQVTDYFHGIYGAQDDYKKFSKKMVIERILRENEVPGESLLTFGDGYVEIENTHEVGGLAVGVATNEAERKGIDAWKRERLIKAHADVIVPDFREAEILVPYLFGETNLR